MSKLYQIKDLLSLKNYSKKYKITLRKVYRYIEGSIIDSVNIDGVSYLSDKPINTLKEDGRSKFMQNIVKNLTKQIHNVKILTMLNSNIPEVPDNQEGYIDKNLTIEDNHIDKILTIRESELKLMVKSDGSLSIREMKEKEILIKKYLK